MAKSIWVMQRNLSIQVTLVHNLELFGIDPAEFAHGIQVKLACSTAVSPLPGKNKGMEVLIQGNQVTWVAELLIGEWGRHRRGGTRDL